MSTDTLVCINLHTWYKFAKTPSFSSLPFSLVQRKIPLPSLLLQSNFKHQLAKMMSMWQPFGASHRSHEAVDPFFANPIEVRARNCRH